MSVRRFAVLCVLLAGAVLAALHFVSAAHVQARAEPVHSVMVTQTMDIPLPDASTRTLADFARNYVDVPHGALDWRLLGATKEIDVEGKTKDGYDFQYFKPGFTPAVQALDGKVVTIKGFMFPLDAAEKQLLFLLGPFPVNCPFHYHVGPSLVVEVHAGKRPVKFSYDPVTLRGTLQLVQKDEENSTFYRLAGAEIVR